MNKIIWGAIIGVLTLSSILIWWSVSSKTDLGGLQEDISVTRAETRNMQIPYQSSVINTTPTRVGAPLTEIQLSAEDIRTADQKGLIGMGAPFNNTYITKEELRAEIVEINRKFEGLSEEYQNYIITLRHLEKVENVRKENSKVGEVIDTYYSQTMAQ